MVILPSYSSTPRSDMPLLSKISCRYVITFFDLPCDLFDEHIDAWWCSCAWKACSKHVLYDVRREPSDTGSPLVTRLENGQPMDCLHPWFILYPCLIGSIYQDATTNHFHCPICWDYYCMTTSESFSWTILTTTIGRNPQLRYYEGKWTLSMRFVCWLHIYLIRLCSPPSAKSC